MFAESFSFCIVDLWDQIEFANDCMKTGGWPPPPPHPATARLGGGGGGAGGEGVGAGD